ncbi:unnamed protein product, partial [Amoebophrya sp. A25]|eukprot:GSA25T00026511001.1
MAKALQLTRRPPMLRVCALLGFTPLAFGLISANGTAERAVGKIRREPTKHQAAKGIPAEQWPEALKPATFRINNRRSECGRGTSPRALIFGRRLTPPTAFRTDTEGARDPPANDEGAEFVSDVP